MGMALINIIASHGREQFSAKTNKQTSRLWNPHHGPRHECGYELWAVQLRLDFSSSDCCIWRVFRGSKELKVTSVEKRGEKNSKREIIKKQTQFNLFFYLIHLSCEPHGFILGSFEDSRISAIINLDKWDKCDWPWFHSRNLLSLHV